MLSKDVTGLLLAVAV